MVHTTLDLCAHCAEGGGTSLAHLAPLLPRIAHAQNVDTRALLAADEMLAAGALTAPLTARYAGWDGEEGQAILAGRRSLADLADSALTSGLDPQPRSGRQEYLESVVNRYV